jgi:hypothetical protein
MEEARIVGLVGITCSQGCPVTTANPSTTGIQNGNNVAEIEEDTPTFG